MCAQENPNINMSVFQFVWRRGGEEEGEGGRRGEVVVVWEVFRRCVVVWCDGRGRRECCASDEELQSYYGCGL